jgi:pimeloyl-ACP methyl ester carboxylesterase
MDNVERYAPVSGYFTAAGFELWMIDYPGFGKTTGKISEEKLYAHAAQMYDLAAKRSDNIIIYGRSIGSGIAAQLASVKSCRQLILETPYYSMVSLAKQYVPLYPVKLFLKYKLPTNEYLLKVNAPVTIFHGRKDELIPYDQAEKLSRVKKGIQLITIDEGQHNDLANHPAFSKGLDSVLASNSR